MKTSRKMHLVLIALSVISSWNLSAQLRTDPIRVIPKSPESTAFDQYLNVPVSEATGVVSISIPIYTIKLDGLEIPITLSYYASGVKVDDIATPVGLNWVLNAGGRISRTIFGLDDNEISGWIGNTPINLDTCNSREVLENYYLQIIDPQPDLYSYFFPGGSGQFFHDSNGNILKTTVDDKILTDSLVIWDALGNRFEFCEGEITCKTVTRDCNPMSITCVDLSGEGFTAWPLRKITTARGDSLVYYIKGYGYTTPDVITSCEHTYETPHPYYGTGSDSDTFETRTSIEYGLKTIDSIQSMKEKVKFFYTTDTTLAIMKLKLSRILVTDLLNSDTILNVTLSHDKFAGDPRLKLTEIDFLGTGSDGRKIYSFDYMEGNLPEFGSYKRDIFGYHNANTESHMIPYSVGTDSSLCTLNSFANREVDTTRVLYGILNRMTLPTGGSIRYYYEPNIEEVSGIIHSSPGARIRRIVYENEENAVVKEELFTYAGLAGKDKHIEGVFPFHFFNQNYYDVFPDALKSEIRWTSDPITFLTGQLNQHGYYYETVRHELRDNSNNSGYSVSNYGSYLDNFTISPYLKNSTIYDSQNHPVKRISSLYTSDLQDQSNYINEVVASTLGRSYVYYGVDFYCTGYEGCSGTVSCPGQLEVHYDPLIEEVFTSSVFYKISETSVDYFQNGDDSVTTKKKYKYKTGTIFGNDYILNSGIVNYLFEDDIYVLIDSTAVKYPLDYSSGGFTSNLISEKMIALPVDTRIYKKVDQGQPKVIEGEIIVYNTYGQHLKEYLLENTTPLTIFCDTVAFTIPNSAFKLQVTYLYDENTHRILSITTPGENSTSYMWGYNSLYPIAQVINAVDSQWAYTSFEDSKFGNWAASGSNYNLNQAKTGTRSWSGTLLFNVGESSVLGLWSFNGQPSVSSGSLISSKTKISSDGWTYYEWVIPSSTSLTINSNSKTIDEVRLFPISSSITTFTYNSFGISAVIDVNGSPVYYQYDSFGRLIRIRDHNGNILRNINYNLKHD
ncbi:MAG: hypothetical protein RBS37_00135 [Bacteroidales bacterium]|jgi:YD repeat-containing protein|nr:hypothetical protein [Bacteroidales bacterium]